MKNVYSNESQPILLCFVWYFVPRQNTFHIKSTHAWLVWDLVNDSVVNGCLSVRTFYSQIDKFRNNFFVLYFWAFVHKIYALVVKRKLAPLISTCAERTLIQLWISILNSCAVETLANSHVDSVNICILLKQSMSFRQIFI